MGLLTVNINNRCTITTQAPTEVAHRPPENNGNDGTCIQVLIGVGISYYIDPYLNGIKAGITQIIELFGVSPDHATTAAALLCFTAICVAPTIIWKKLIK
ncbi:hypothetical protein [Pantoea dispersa]|uniref:hypothetical protein n=1 Tax=Pantoea dispersa TaxID=59814 RepID=UPI00301857CA